MSTQIVESPRLEMTEEFKKPDGYKNINHSSVVYPNPQYPQYPVSSYNLEKDEEEAQGSGVVCVLC